MKKSIPKLVLEAYALADKGLSQREIARATGKSRSTVRDWLNERPKPPALTLPPVAPIPPAVDLVTILQDRVRSLESQIRSAKKEDLTAHYVRERIIKLASDPISIPDWVITPHTASNSAGMPTLFASDWHWWERVDPTQIGGVNEYNAEIGHARARKLIEYTIHLLNNHMKHGNYPGIVFALGGDMVSGDIHEELSATNEGEIMPCVVDLMGVLIWCIKTLTDQFGRVFIPCVTGNHGRNTQKIRAKGRNFTSFDWLLYMMLAKYFETDKRITFYIPNGPDALYSVYGRRYLLTHGDQFRGGDGMIGALGPIIRGDHKKRSRNMQVNQAYDTMICGHWHQLIQLQRLIVNGCLKGYDEYAYAGNFPYEPPRQALWLTHPKWGITFSCPVQVESPSSKVNSKWVEVIR